STRASASLLRYGLLSRRLRPGQTRTSSTPQSPSSSTKVERAGNSYCIPPRNSVRVPSWPSNELCARWPTDAVQERDQPASSAGAGAEAGVGEPRERSRRAAPPSGVRPPLRAPGPGHQNDVDLEGWRRPGIPAKGSGESDEGS